MTDHYGGREARSEDGAAAAGRVVSFSDVVFAIAITLLVLPLTEARLTDAGLVGELLALGPQLFAFALSFLIIGRFWLTHHRMFRHIAQLDGRLLTLNLLLLLDVAFLPFPTKVVGEHGTITVAAVFYAASMAGTRLVFAALWSRRGPPAVVALAGPPGDVFVVDPGGAGQSAGGFGAVVAVDPGHLGGRAEVLTGAALTVTPAAALNHSQ